ncbi:hypothetical protein P7C70_g1648, partial [Phenoliferia sp. Uapishka_3]
MTTEDFTGAGGNQQSGGFTQAGGQRLGDLSTGPDGPISGGSAMNVPTNGTAGHSTIPGLLMPSTVGLNQKFGPAATSSYGDEQIRFSGKKQHILLDAALGKGAAFSSILAPAPLTYPSREDGNGNQPPHAVKDEEPQDLTNPVSSHPDGNENIQTRKRLFLRNPFGRGPPGERGWSEHGPDKEGGPRPVLPAGHHRNMNGHVVHLAPLHSPTSPTPFGESMEAKMSAWNLARAKVIKSAEDTARMTIRAQRSLDKLKVEMANMKQTEGQ